MHQPFKSEVVGCSPVVAPNARAKQWREPTSTQMDVGFISKQNDFHTNGSKIETATCMRSALNRFSVKVADS